MESSAKLGAPNSAVAIRDNTDWKSKYLELEKRFDDYKKLTLEKVNRMSVSESKLILLKKQTEEILRQVELERQEVTTTLKTLDGEKVTAFQRGVESSSYECNELHVIYENLQRESEVLLSTAKEKIQSLEDDKWRENVSNQRKIADLETRIKFMELQEKTTSGDMKELKADAESRMSALRQLKLNAVKDYTDLYEKFTELNMKAHQLRTQLKEEKMRGDDLKNENAKLLQENLSLKQYIVEQRLHSEKELNSAKALATEIQSNMHNSLKLQVSWALSQFSVITEDLEKKMKNLNEMISNGKFQQPSGTEATKGALKTLLKEVSDTLQKVTLERKESSEKKVVIEKALKSCANSVFEANHNLFKYLETMGVIHREILEAVGIRSFSLDMTEVSAMLGLDWAENAEGLGENIVPDFLVTLQRREKISKKLADTANMWKLNFEEFAKQFRGRKVEVEKMLEKEKLERMADLHNWSKQLKIYKVLSSKLQSRVKDTLKLVQENSLPNSRFFETYEDEYGRNKVVPIAAIQESYEEFAIMLQRAEDCLTKIENSGTGQPRKFRRSSSLPTNIDTI